jgi:hypothetical protein
MRGQVVQGRDIVVRGADDIPVLSLDDLRKRELSLDRKRASAAGQLERTDDNIAALEERIEGLREQQKGAARNKPLLAEDNLRKLREERAAQRKELDGVESELGDVRKDIDHASPPPPKPPELPSPAPIGELDVPAAPTELAGTKMHSWRSDVYVGTAQSGYRENVETLLLKDENGPLSKALLEDGKIVPYQTDAAFRKEHHEMFIAGHVHSKHAADKDVIILTSAERNAGFSAQLESGTNERFGDFAYVIQGIAVEPGTAWKLVETRGLPRSVVENAPRIRLAR